MRVTDEEAAAKVVATFVTLSKDQEEAYTEITAILASGNEDSIVDAHHLFGLYDKLYFNSKLRGRAELSWSPRLTLCAGICELSKNQETKKWTRIRVKLSEPLLKLRPRSDLLNTLLHESIHAYLFITSDFSHVRDPTGGHGPGFQAIAAAINSHGGYKITQFHEFHDEVDSYRTHIWLCDGPCRTKPPYFGLVKRVMNRAPEKTDPWWSDHEKECGGTYHKIAEPDLTKKQIENLSGMERAGRQKNKIDTWVKNDVQRKGEESSTEQKTKPVSKRSRSADSQLAAQISAPATKVLLISCPICDTMIKDIYINEHLDKEHA